MQKCIARFFSLVLFAYLLGNNDLPLRTFSIIFTRDEEAKLAPIYDFISTAPYSNTFSDCYMALPLLKIEENEHELAPGFNT